MTMDAEELKLREGCSARRLTPRSPRRAGSLAERPWSHRQPHTWWWRDGRERRRQPPGPTRWPTRREHRALGHVTGMGPAGGLPVVSSNKCLGGEDKDFDLSGDSDGFFDRREDEPMDPFRDSPRGALESQGSPTFVLSIAASQVSDGSACGAEW